MKTVFRFAVAMTMATLLTLPMASAQTKKKSAITGAGLGALAGQLLGGNTESTVIGAAVGGGVGYVVGNEKDKTRAAELEAQRQAEARAAAEADAAEETPEEENEEQLDESRWQVKDISPPDLVPPYQSKLVTFRSDGTVETMTTDPEGEVTFSKESFRIVGDTLVINKPGYLINIDFEKKDDELILSNDEFVILLTPIKSE